MKDNSLNNEEVEALRREYSSRQLVEENIVDDPVEQFAIWFRQALAADIPDANAMTLATAAADGKPSARIVLLKGFDRSGFRFYTNYTSRKGQELQENPHASLCFYWSQLERQVRIEGSAKRMSTEQSRAYFAKRPRQSQLGAWASQQSAEVSSRAELEEQFQKVEDRFKDQEISLPDFWGGFVLQPVRFEFWQGRPGRLHDRIVYRKEGERWQSVRLAP